MNVLQHFLNVSGGCKVINFHFSGDEANCFMAMSYDMIGNTIPSV
jgi:hypothetical protein